MVAAQKAKLTTNEVGTVVAMIEAWEGPLTWDRLTDRVALLLGRPFSRQALDAHAKIKLAYQSRKVSIRKVLHSFRAGKLGVEEMSPEMTMALQRAEALQERVDRLQTTIDVYEVKFVTWLYNARNRGLSEGELNSSLPPVDRGADKGPISEHRKRVKSSSR
jgi:hypothetical protein